MGGSLPKEAFPKASSFAPALTPPTGAFFWAFERGQLALNARTVPRFYGGCRIGEYPSFGGGLLTGPHSTPLRVYDRAAG
jgi:hypothetical protein